MTKRESGFGDLSTPGNSLSLGEGEGGEASRHALIRTSLAT